MQTRASTRASGKMARNTDGVLLVEYCLGVYTCADGARYEGEWREGLPMGKGTYNYADGDRYEGQYKQGKRHGRGIFPTSHP
jgi:hypothetical protein